MIAVDPALAIPEDIAIPRWAANGDAAARADPRVSSLWLTDAIGDMNSILERSKDAYAARGCIRQYPPIFGATGDLTMRKYFARFKRSPNGAI
jgi:hypothetical protein